MAMVWPVPSYPSLYDANYLWEDPQPFTNAPSAGSCEVSASLLRSGYYEVPASLVAPYGVYDVNVEAVATDGTIEQMNLPLIVFDRGRVECTFCFPFTMRQWGDYRILTVLP